MQIEFQTLCVLSLTYNGIHFYNDKFQKNCLFDNVKVSNNVKRTFTSTVPQCVFNVCRNLQNNIVKEIYVLIPSQHNLAFVYHNFPRLRKKTRHMKLNENKSLETFDFLFCIRCFCFKGVYNHVHNNIVYSQYTLQSNALTSCRENHNNKKAICVARFYVI